jgi:hypothetical protein
MRNVMATVSALAAAVTLAASAAPAAAATMLDVGVGEGCSKSTCFDDKGVFTKTWTSHDASGPLTIGQILLDRGVLGDFDGKTFRISFTLNGEELGTWGSYTMGGIGGDELNFAGQNFTWNPEDGDLVLVLELVPPPKAGAGGLFFTSNFEDEGEDGPNGGGSMSGGVSLEAFIPSGAPEPSTWALMIGGFGLAGAALRRRARAVVGMQPTR